MVAYIGPGISLASIFIVVVVLAIVFASLIIVIIRPLKRLVEKIKNIKK